MNSNSSTHSRPGGLAESLRSAFLSLSSPSASFMPTRPGPKKVPMSLHVYPRLFQGKCCHVRRAYPKGT